MGQSLSTTQFYVYGKRHFTKSGYLRHIKEYTEPVQSSAHSGEDGKDLSGKTVIVTGANSGLGKQVATYCASKNAKLYMLCRNQQRAETAREEIISALPKDSSNDYENNIKIVLCDVSDLESVRKAAKELQTSETEIHCLVCNAGVLLNEQQNTKNDGLETTFASHLLGGTYLLTKLLLPQLKEASDSRVVVVTSGGMYSTPMPSWDVLTSYTTSTKEVTENSNFKYDGVMAYSYAKRAQVLLVEEWSKVVQQQDKSAPKFVTVHPGWSQTAGLDDAFGSGVSFLKPLRSHWEGAEGVAWLTACDSDKLESGALYLDRTVQTKHMSGLLLREGSFTKNSQQDVDALMEKLKETAGL